MPYHPHSWGYRIRPLPTSHGCRIKPAVDMIMPRVFEKHHTENPANNKISHQDIPHHSHLLASLTPGVHVLLHRRLTTAPTSTSTSTSTSTPPNTSTASDLRAGSGHALPAHRGYPPHQDTTSCGPVTRTCVVLSAEGFTADPGARPGPRLGRPPPPYLPHRCRAARGHGYEGFAWTISNMGSTYVQVGVGKSPARLLGGWGGTSRGG
jgi:hypothetical protein